MQFSNNDMIQKAPELITEKWLNIPAPVTLEGLRGKVVLIYAFQMLCPGCVEHSIPQARNVFSAFPASEVAVLGLHTVFEHHEAMKETSLRAFLHEYRVEFPVGIDKPSGNSPIPETMALYKMRGTPTTLLIDRQGSLRIHKFGHIPDLILGAEIMSLIKENNENSFTYTKKNDKNINENTKDICGLDGCK